MPLLDETNPFLLVVINALTVFNLRYIIIEERHDVPQGPLVLIDGTEELEARRTALDQLTKQLDSQNGFRVILDLVGFPGRSYDRVYVLTAPDGTVVSIALVSKVY